MTARRATSLVARSLVPLARGRHFILALAPLSGAAPHDSSDHAVVYRMP